MMRSGERGETTRIIRNKCFVIADIDLTDIN